MISIENNLEVCKRQAFNQPYSCIKRINQDSHDFINNYDRQEKTIIWLDYTDPKQLRRQIEEFHQVIQHLDTFDIIKITLNAHPPSYLSAPQGASSSEIKKLRINRLKEILGEEDLFPSADISEDMMTPKRFPHALTLILKYAANLALRGNNNLFFQPLTCFSYADGMQMMTLTGIILDNDKKQRKDFLNSTKLQKWALINRDWSEPLSINIPDLTVRERLYIDSLLPKASSKTIQKKLGFNFARTEKDSLEMIEMYIMFYRQSPYFSRIFI